MLARMPMARDEYEKLRPRSRLTLFKQKLLNMIARITIHPGLRIWLYRQIGVNIGEDCTIEMYANLDDQFPELIFLEGNTGPSRHVIIICHDDAAAKAGHDETSETGFVDRHGFVAPVIMKRYSAAAAGSILLPGVTLHEGALVGAGAVVTRDIPAHSVAVGVPARVIKKISAAGEDEPVNPEQGSESE
jgi:acetyltransferase-like isoleucine patch superfamily enzyme